MCKKIRDRMQGRYTRKQVTKSINKARYTPRGYAPEPVRALQDTTLVRFPLAVLQQHKSTYRILKVLNAIERGLFSPYYYYVGRHK